MLNKNNQTFVACYIVISALIIGSVETFPAKASAVPNQPANSGASFLNPDGTLKLDANVSGSINLQEWDVQLDSARGPVFNSKEENQNISPLADVEPGQWDGLGSSGAMNGPVSAIAVSGTDVYVIGNFTNAGGIPEADYVAKWDGAKWSALGGNGAGNGAIPGYLYAIAISGTDVYIGGDFESINNYGNIINYGAVARWDGTNWSAVGNLNIGNFGLNGHVVRTMVVSGANLYVGGMFYDLYSNGVIIANGIGLIKWNGTNWSTVGGNSGINNINAMAIIGSDIYVGGSFFNVAGIPEADFIAKWNGTNWSALGSNGAGDGALDNNVYEITAHGTDVYVGGIFDNAGSIPEADVIAKWDGTSWSALGSNGAGDGALDPSYMYVYSIFVNGSNIYIGGAIWHINNHGVILNTVTSIAKWDGSNWSGLGNDGAGGSSLNDVVYDIAMAEGKLYIGGAFWKTNNSGVLLSEASYFAKWDGTDWSAVGKGDGSINASSVYAVAAVGTDVYVGGCFENVVNNPSFDFLAKWNGKNWSNVRGTGFISTPITNCVYALATDGTNLYVGGAFQNADDIPNADYIAKWDGTNWSALGSNGVGDGSLNTQGVFAIATTGSDVYVGGSFTNVNNNGTILTAADYVAKWNGTDWSALRSNGAGDGSIRTTDPDGGAQINAIAINGADVYVGGWFQDVRNGSSTLASADYIAKWNGTNWSALGSNGSGNGALSDFVGSIAVKGNEVYAGGKFMDAGSVPQADFIAKWNGVNWVALGNDGAGDGALKQPSPYFSVVNSIASDGLNIYVGGIFTDVNNYGSVLGAADYIAKWDGVNWSTLGSNGAANGSLNSRVNSIVLSGSKLYVGGNFTDINNNGTVMYYADRIAVYTDQPAIHKDTTGVFRPSNGALYLKNSHMTGFADVQINYGIGGDYPVTGDWDGDGITTIGVYRNGTFFLRNENTIGYADVTFPFGLPGDQPVAGDWDGDGVDTIGVYRNGMFLLRNDNSSGAPDMIFALGIPGDVGIAGDWDGDGKDTTGVFRPSNGALYLKYFNTTGFADVQINYGIGGDQPVTGDWNNDGVDTIGVYRNGTFFLRNSNTIGYADIQFDLGIPGDMPIAGNWDGKP